MLIENFINNRMENESWENIDDVIEEAITKFGMENVEQELTENNSDYLEYLWRVQDNIEKRQRVRKELEENPYIPVFYPDMELLGSNERVSFFRGTNKV